MTLDDIIATFDLPAFAARFLADFHERMARGNIGAEMADEATTITTTEGYDLDDANLLGIMEALGAATTAHLDGDPEALRHYLVQVGALAILAVRCVEDEEA